MARTYKRDALGRFAGGGGGGGRPKARSVSKGANRLTRDNSGRITSVGGSGATARGGRLKTASGNQRATQLDRLKGRIAGTVGKARGGARMKSAGLNKDGMAVFKSTGKPAKTYRIPQQNTQKAKVRLNTSAPAFSRRLQRTDPSAAAQRRMQSEMARPMQFSGRKPGGAADRRFRDQASTASYNRQRRSEGVAREARKLLSLASQSPSDWATRARYSTVKKPSKANPAWSYSDLSAWGSTSRRRR